MSGRNHPEYREQLQTKNPAESTASKIPSSGDHPDFHDPSYSPPGKTRLDLGKQPMKLGKKATDPGNSRHLGHPALKNRANPGNLPVGHDPGINWTQGPQKAKTPQRPNTGRQRYRATNGKKTGSQAATMLRRPASSQRTNQPLHTVPLDELADLQPLRRGIRPRLRIHRRALPGALDRLLIALLELPR